jgi:hypothetical protein
VAERITIRWPEGLGLLGVGALVAILVAATVAAAAAAGSPSWAPLLGSLLVLGAALAIFFFGRDAPLLALLALVPLFPVSTIGFFAEGLDGRGNTLRAAFIVLCLGALVLAYGAALPKPPQRLRPIVAGLVLLAALGALSALANGGAAQGTLSIAQQLVGQPLVFAALLIFVPAYLIAGGGQSRERLLVAFSLGVFFQAGLVSAELLSGAAFDELRDLTRAQGTVGADFLGAFAMMALFVGGAEWTRGAPGSRLRAVGAATVLAAAVIIAGSVARGALLGILLGGTYVVLSDPRYRSRALLIGATGLILLLGSLLTPVGELWKSRFDARSVQAFDRPATWISGLRIGADHPLTGLSEREIVRGIDDQREYRQTPLGDTGVLPHNIWILAFAQGGVGAALVLLVMTGLLFAALRAPPGGRSSEERFYVGGLLGIAAIAIVNNVFTHPELMVPALMLVSLVVCRPPDRMYGPPPPTGLSAAGDSDG